MGYGRAGFYSYAWIERALGLRSLSNAERILPEFQHLSVGDIIPIEPGGSGYRVTSLDPNRLLVLAMGESDGGIMGAVMKQAHGASTWVYMLHELDSEHTRLIVRWRARLKLSLKMPPSALFQMVSIEPGQFVMERKMLLGIKQRAERGRSKEAAERPSPGYRPQPSPGEALMGMRQPTSRAEGERYEDP